MSTFLYPLDERRKEINTQMRWDKCLYESERRKIALRVLIFLACREKNEKKKSYRLYKCTSVRALLGIKDFPVFV